MLVLLALLIRSPSRMSIYVTEMHNHSGLTQRLLKGTLRRNKSTCDGSTLEFHAAVPLATMMRYWTAACRRHSLQRAASHDAKRSNDIAGDFSGIKNHCRERMPCAGV